MLDDVDGANFTKRPVPERKREVIEIGDHVRASVGIAV
jgi:hypothetical protein